MEILSNITGQHILIAFTIGIFSACSLPLGTITSAFWKPGDRAIAFLMAFGGGALLAALTIDLVGSALEKGHFHILALGCIIGSLLFIGLNRIINDHGGFYEKPLQPYITFAVKAEHVSNEFFLMYDALIYSAISLMQKSKN